MKELKNDDIRNVLHNLTATQPNFVKAGVDAILDDVLNFDALKRMATNLSNANNDFGLQAVEASLHTMMAEVRKMNQDKSPYMPDEKASLYLSTLQNLTFSLGDWPFENGKENHYVPEILRKYNQTMVNATAVGITPDSVHDLCFNPQYQSNSMPHLSDFELLDDQRMDTINNALKQYRVTKDPTLLTFVSQIENQNQQHKQKAMTQQPATKDYGIVQCVDTPNHVLDKMINNLKAKFGRENITTAYLTEHISEVYDAVTESTHVDDIQRLGKLAKILLDRVAVLEKSLQQTQTVETLATPTMGR